jgi:hypothetical protein
MTTIVPPSGPTDCKIAFVGEAPGADEVRYMKPFVGKAGKIFSNILRSVGVIREHCYITNVVKERPPGNDISKFIKGTLQGVRRSKSKCNSHPRLDSNLCPNRKARDNESPRLHLGVEW